MRLIRGIAASPPYSLPRLKKSFSVEVSVKGEILGVGLGRSKKAAEMAAAEQALIKKMGGGDE